MFLSKRYQEIFAEHQLVDFDQLWAKKIEWFEEPNFRRGGWSGVGHVVLRTEHDELDVFVKKQKNHGRKTLFHPKVGEPTFKREFLRLQYLEKHQINAAKVVFYAEQHGEGDKAILITETLMDYFPLDTILEQDSIDHALSRKQRRRLLSSVAQLLKKFHVSGLEHRALYAKHIFVKNASTTPEVALIDLEKSRFNLVLLRRAFYDLAQLNRHTKHLSQTERLYFLLQYFELPKLNWRLKLFIHRLMKRTNRKPTK